MADHQVTLRIDHQAENMDRVLDALRALRNAAKLVADVDPNDCTELELLGLVNSLSEPIAWADKVLANPWL
jgi:hypothetical protein